MSAKRYLPYDVLTAARQRVEWTFDNFKRIYLSFSAGKDSTVMLHMVMAEAIKRQVDLGATLVYSHGGMTDSFMMSGGSSFTLTCTWPSSRKSRIAAAVTLMVR
mgnify:CR=1 FL=1